MILIVSGTRTCPRKLAHNAIWEFIDEHRDGDAVTEIIHGASGNVDMEVEKVVFEFVNLDIKVTPYPAEWDKYDKAAGPMRNKSMAPKGDYLLAIWDGKSPGTHNMIQEAVMHKIGVVIVPITNTVKAMEL